MNSYVIRWGSTQSNDFFIVGLELSPFIQRWRCAETFRLEKLSVWAVAVQAALGIEEVKIERQSEKYEMSVDRDCHVDLIRLLPLRFAGLGPDDENQSWLFLHRRGPIAGVGC